MTGRPLRWAVAACLVGFLAGFGLRPAVNGLLSPTATQVPYAATVSQLTAPADTILLREVVHDTVFQTRVILREVSPAGTIAKAELHANPLLKEKELQAEATNQAPEDEASLGCSMLCDDIPYSILAHN